MTKEIPLTRGATTLVDDTDYEWLSQWKWFLHSGGYAVRSIRLHEGERGGIIYMHRVIINAAINTEVDHINRDRLDNRRINLRSVTHAGNAHNSSAHGGLSKYKGVHQHPQTKRWRAQITYERQCRHLGYFATEEAAAKAYDDAARELYGIYAHLNFP